jgi:hypothetical protein
LIGRKQRQQENRFLQFVGHVVGDAQELEHLFPVVALFTDGASLSD